MTDRFRVGSEDLQSLRFGPIGPHLEGFAALLSQQGYCKANGWLKVRLAASAQRSLLGFLFQKKGRIFINLSSAVPRVANRKLSQRPRYLEKHQVEKVLRGCDRRERLVLSVAEATGSICLGCFSGMMRCS